MDGNFKEYDWVASSGRVKQILDQLSGQFEETDALPDRENLTFTNGFYGRCSAIFVDIRDSSDLPAKYKRPTLAKIYRSFISEMVAVLNSAPFVREVNIVGDCVWAVYNTPSKPDIDDVFSVAARANTLLELLNHHYKKKNIDPLTLGIGVDWGRVLMIKAGYSGSGINDVIYMGDIVNKAAHLAHKAGRGWWAAPMWMGSAFYSNLNEPNKALMSQQYDVEIGTVYTGNVVNLSMQKWVNNNC